MRAAKATAQSFPALLSQQVAQFRHSKDLVRYGGVETPWTIDEFGRLLSQVHSLRGVFFCVTFFFT